MLWRIAQVLGGCAAVWCGVASAFAQSPDTLAGGSRPDAMLFFSGFDVWRFGYGGYAGMELTPPSLDTDGPLLRLFSSGGVDRFGTGAFNKTQTLRASFMPGWRIERGAMIFKAFVGLDAEARLPFDPVLPRQHFLGARVATELWWEPTEIMMVAASAGATTIERGYGARIAAGWRVWGEPWIGPEVQVNSDIYSTQYRIGVHVTGWRFADLEWSAAAGLVHDSYGRDGAYGRVAVALKR